MFFLLRLKNILVFAFIFSASANAATTSIDRGGFHISVEPIIGYEFTQVNTPFIHTRGMLIYGARVTAGHKLIAGEAEYTMGSTNETFVNNDENIKTDKQNARLGIRSSISLLHGIDFIFRGGGQATKLNIATTTISAATTLTDSSDWSIHPYAGAGLQAYLFHSFSLALDATYLFKSVKDWSQNDIQTSFSFKIHLPTK